MILAQWKKETAGQWVDIDSHAAATRYFNPYASLQKVIYKTLLNIWHMKFWLLCVAILIFTGRSRWHNYKSQKAVQDANAKQQRMQVLLQEINQHEQLQAQTKDYRLLTRRLDEARKIKNDGLDIAIELDMTDRSVFTAFMTQCDNVIKDIQGKLSVGSNEVKSS